MNKIAFFTLLFLLQACAQKPYHGRLDFLGKFPSKLNEVSGIAKENDSIFWVIEDNGNKDILYQVNIHGQLIKKYKIGNAKNDDWEDLTTDQNGNIYIGDFGNNDNDRKDLVIYKLHPSTSKKSKIEAEKIKFEYPEQEKYPPKKENRVFDAEAFFHWKGHLYIFTKNRSYPYNGQTMIYRVPDKKGDYKAKLIGQLVICENPKYCSVTSADISSDGKKIVLLGYGYVYMLENFNKDDFTNSKLTKLYLKHETQMESVCFTSNDELIIADEQSQSKGRNIYRYDLGKALKTKTDPKGKP
ncbi:MAG: hypothetical protein HKP24_13520 [Croceitalea sp.]|nr:hypothetical protein [Croceitalea sp.]MBT8238940.1 hypothetical protein [Croceitalea sp.]NNM19579.1 hypothetical protein [Croceitalea sp.]